MKKLFWFLNTLVAVVTLGIYGLHYLPPSSQSIFLGGTLFLPVCFVVNIFFLLYWLLQLQKKFLLSGSILTLGFFWLKCYVAFNTTSEISSSNTSSQEKSIKIASYNAHYFRSVDKRNTYFEKEFVEEFLNKENIDMLFVEEGATLDHGIGIERKFLYHHKHIARNSIYSNYPIIYSEVLPMKGDKYRAVYSDMVVGKDTIRAYNLHLSSYKYPKQSNEIVKKGARNLFNRLKSVFKIQEEQINFVVNHIENSPYPVIIAGDFNGLPNLYPYQHVTTKLKLKDTFVEAGNGLGATYDFSYFPLRIDYIFVPETVKVRSHRVIKTDKWSDHYPIVTEIVL